MRCYQNSITRKRDEVILYIYHGEQAQWHAVRRFNVRSDQTSLGAQKQGDTRIFTAQYNVHMLVYYELHGNYMEAARREKRFKNWCRKWKLNLIEGVNPKWNDLYEEICR